MMTQQLRATRLLMALVLAAIARPVQGVDFMAGADISSLPVAETMVRRIATVAGSGRRRSSDPQQSRRELVSSAAVRGSTISKQLQWRIRSVRRSGFGVHNCLGSAQSRRGNVLLDFMYSDTWADPSRQWKPDAWRSLAMPALQQQVYRYAKQTLQTFKRPAFSPGIVQIGDEIAVGLL